MSVNYGVRRNPPAATGASRLPRNEGVPGSNPGVGLGDIASTKFFLPAMSATPSWATTVA